jgi:transposase
LDLAGSYRAVFDEVVPGATQVADPFHVVKLANEKLDECRRRVQNETFGHRGRKSIPSIAVAGCSPSPMSASKTTGGPSS